MTTVLLTLGRLPKCLDLARGFAASGCRVLVAEPFARHLTGASRAVARSFTVPAPRDGQAAYLRGLAEIVDREGVDLVVPVSEETMHVAFLPGIIGDRARVFTMKPEQVLALHDKGGFIRQGEASGVAVPETHRLGSDGAPRLAAQGTVVVKPVFSCSGRGLRILPAGTPLPAPDPALPAIVQRFVPGQEYSSCTIAHRGKALSTVIYRGALMQGTVAIRFARVTDQPAIARWIECFVAATGWSGFIAFDFIVDEAGEAWGIECNPRANSGLHFWRPEDIARAILDPETSPAPRFRPETELQQFYACLTELRMFRKSGWERLGRLLTTTDVTWDRRDPMPFLTMTYNSWTIIRMAMARGVGFGEVATLDVGWYVGAKLFHG